MQVIKKNLQGHPGPQGPPHHSVPPSHPGPQGHPGGHPPHGAPPQGHHPGMPPAGPHGMHPGQYPGHPMQRQNPASPGPQGPPGPGQPRSQVSDNLHALQKAIDTMEEKGMQDDQRYSQLIALRARTSAAAVGNSLMTQLQMSQLRNQIMAYRCLARNQPIPSSILLGVQGKRPDGSPQFPTPPSSPFQPQTGGQTPVGTEQPSTSGEASGDPGTSGVTPQGVKPGLPNAGGQQTQRGPGQLMPSKQNRITTLPKPCGIDPIVLLQERENRVAARIAARIEQVSSLVTDMSEKLRVQAQIELRALRCLNFQRQLRSEILSCIRRDTTLETAVNIKAYKRTKRQGLREARATEKLEKQQKLEAERKRRQKNQEFLNSVLTHGKEFKEFHRQNQAKLAKINKAIINYHANAEREQKKEQERIEKERMRRYVKCFSYLRQYILKLFYLLQIDGRRRRGLP